MAGASPPGVEGQDGGAVETASVVDEAAVEMRSTVERTMILEEEATGAPVVKVPIPKVIVMAFAVVAPPAVVTRIAP